MSKPRFFVNRPVAFAADITGPDVNHIRNVLRLVVGDEIEIADSNQQVLKAKISAISADTVTAIIESSRQIEPEPAEVVLFQAIPKAHKLDTIIRQATEIGIAGIVPFVSERVVVKLEPEKAAFKRERWQRIASEAAKQAHRRLVPEVAQLKAWTAVLTELKEYDQVIVFWEELSGTLPYQVLRCEANRVAIVIGPEGGLSEREVDALKEIGADIATMGESILRVETAAPVAAALIMYDIRRCRQQRLD